MTQTPAKYGLYVGLYSLFWVTISGFGYRVFFVDSNMALPPGPYFFMIGLLWLVCAAIRTVRPTEYSHYHRRDPVRLSFFIAGLILIAAANIA